MGGSEKVVQNLRRKIIRTEIQGRVGDRPTLDGKRVLLDGDHFQALQLLNQQSHYEGTIVRSLKFTLQIGHGNRLFYSLSYNSTAYRATFTDWIPEQPSNQSLAKDCVALFNTKVANSETFKNIKCNNRHRFICQVTNDHIRLKLEGLSIQFHETRLSLRRVVTKRTSSICRLE